MRSHCALSLATLPVVRMREWFVGVFVNTRA